MNPRFLSCLCVALLTLHVAPLPARAQASSDSSDSQSGYTFHTNSRVVLTDVTVTDKRGNPVHGLKATDFRIFDNKDPQEIASFEEHGKGDAVLAPAPSVSPPGVFSNAYLEHPPRVLNILFIDLTNIEIADQMYLNYQLGKFFDTLRPDEPVAIYARPGNASILLQGFTSDPARLRAAVKKLLPHYPPLGREYMDDVETLHQIAAYLNQLPGRKNVLWLSGGSAILQQPGVPSRDAGEWRAIYDELETQRIAIYPIDVRGMTMASVSVNARGQSQVDRTAGMPQHGLMNEVAQATGGRAVYDNNGIANAVAHIVDEDGEYYTLSYSPHHFSYDNKWHKVQVTLPKTNYTLSYRRGYFADGTSPTPTAGQTRKRLGPNGATEITSTSRMPIIFEAQIHAGAPTDSSIAHTPRKGTSPYTVESSLPLDAFNIKNVDGKWKVECGAEIIALNSDGSLITHESKNITFTLRDEAARHPAGQELPLEEEVDLTKGDVYIYFAIFDMGSKRLGALEIPYHVDSPKRPRQSHTSE